MDLLRAIAWIGERKKKRGEATVLNGSSCNPKEAL
jgi:hypothetical protein